MQRISVNWTSLWAGVMAAAALTVGHGISAQGGPIDAARSYVQQNHQALGLAASDVANLVVSSSATDRHNGVTHVYFQQQHRGIDAFNGILNVSLTAGGAVLTVGNRFIPNLAAAAGDQEPQTGAVEAAHHAAGHLQLQPSEPFRLLALEGGPDEVAILSDAGIAEQPVQVGLTWVRAGDRVRLAWKVELETVDGDHWWQAFVDAATGESLGIVDLVVSETVESIALAVGRPAGTPPARAATAAAAEAASSLDPDGASYRVFPLPFESPSDGGRALITNPADPASSPFGWHDTNGAQGAEFTVTRGNNVHAYTDVDANNLPDPGSDPDGGASLTFDFPLDLATQNPPAYRPAAVTNLFYWNNIMHDVTHRYGFDEASGNFQVNNYGNGGVGGDDVRAEAQDGSGTNNANFGTGVEGVRPRMQMFVWTHPNPNILTVNTPAVIAGDYPASGAAFGPTVAAVGPITGNVTLVNDNAGVSNTDACEPLVGFPAGNIALLDRGACPFVIKVKNAQNAGAVAVIVANNVAGNPITMGGVDPTITIPSVMVSLDNGNLFKANAPVNATLRANPLTSINRDSDLDAGVIAHEYGHGISNRLTGGPNTVACLNNAEQMGEGWSDWFALALTTHPFDTATTPRGVGSYLIYQPPDGNGIRPTPYTTDVAVNPSSYASVANPAISQPHGIGYVWNTMLWEMYWNLVDRYGYNANIYDAGSGGNNLAMQFVMDGMKLQPCQPGFVDGRNAILAADQALTGGANSCEIWRAFAKRGLGASASQGSPFNRFDGVEAFDLPASCTAATFGGFKPPVGNPPTINSSNAGSTVPVKFTLSGPLSGIDSQPVNCTTLVPTGEPPSPLASPGSTGLTKKGDSYHVNWKTDKAWENTCRRLTVRIPAAADAYAYFQFR